MRTSYRLRLIISVSQHFNNPVYFIFTESVSRIFVNSLGRSAVVGAEILVGDIIDIWSEQIAKELGKHFIMIVF